MRKVVALQNVEQLEAREVPAASLLADVNTTGAAAFSPFIPNAGATVQGKALFTASTGQTIGLYSSDGTAAGTTQLTKQDSPSGSNLVFGAVSLKGTTDRAYFTQYDSKTGSQIWSSDATAAGTKQLDIITPNSSLLGNTTTVGNKFLFVEMTAPTGPNYAHSWLLRATDGTTTTTLLTHPNTIGDLLQLGDKVVFMTGSVAPGAFQSSTTIWISDGTPAGTKAWAQLPVGAQTGSAIQGNWAGWAGGKLYFAVNDTSYNSDGQPSGHGEELWVSDGTAAGTKMLQDINPTKAATRWYPEAPEIQIPSSSQPSQFTTIGNSLYFVANDGVNGTEVWMTDGKTTKMVSQVNPPSDTAALYGNGPVTSLKAIGGKLYFVNSTYESGPQLYATDGTTTTVLTKQSYPKLPINTNHPPLPAPEASVGPATGMLQVVGSVGQTVYFMTGNDFYSTTLWSTNGTAAGTKQVLVGGKPLKSPASIANTTSKLLFSADDGTTGQQLYATDSSTTNLVTKINTNTIGSGAEDYLAVGNRAYFSATGNDGRSGIYATDGTSTPVALLKVEARPAEFDFTASFFSQQLKELTNSGGKVYTIATYGEVGRQLWVIDGNSAKMLKDVTINNTDLVTNHSGPLGIANLTDAGGKLFFTLDMPGTGQQIWTTDGTTAGTKLVKTVFAKSSFETTYATYNAEVPSLPLRHMTAVGSKVYFTAGARSTGNQLWVSDGTAAGTKEVLKIGKDGPADV